VLPDSPSGASQILLPVRASTIALSLLAAMILNFLPWPALGIVPDFVALVLAFWCVRQPRLVGLGLGWFLGLVMDAGNGVLLGQHALAYSLLAFGAITLSRRMLWFGPGGQALHVLPLLLLAQLVVALVRLATGNAFWGWGMLVSPLLGALLWAPLSWLLLAPQRRALADEPPRAL
jgi:rod shape-determining protein MreD